MKKKQMTALISLVVGGVILSSAAIANFATSNGYNIYKESVRKIFEQENYTLKIAVDVTVDDEQLLSGDFIEQYDKASGAYVKKENSYDKTNAERPTSSYEEYYQDGIRITRYSPEYDSDTEQYKENSTYHVEDIWLDKTPNAIFSKEKFGDEGELFDKYFKFASSCADMFVGDIKNNFVLTGTDGNLATYEANLDLFQIPEVVNSGADLIVSQVKKDLERRRLYSDYEEDFDAYIEKFVFDPFISGANCIVTVDDEGRLVNNVLSAEVSGKDESGESHKMAVKLEFSFSDYGTTVPERIDLNGKGIERSSDEIRTRIDELNKLLAGDLSKDDRENYETELKVQTKLIETFEKNGPIDSVEYYSRERIVERAEAIEAEKAADDTDAADAGIGVIGGADGPTEVVVTK